MYTTEGATSHSIATTLISTITKSEGILELHTSQSTHFQLGEAFKSGVC